MPVIFKGRAARAFVFGTLFTMGCAGLLPARDAFVLLSGGGTQMENNYSQYLQAKAMSQFFDRSYPRDSVWTFFGAGNVEGAQPLFSDVYRQIKRDGLLLDSWLPGTLPHNRPATREEFLPALRNEILPAVADGGTLYLFVGDHGARTRGRNGESVIVLWGMFRSDISEHGWSESETESLGVSELRRVLTEGIGRGRVVFCMTQCHAGGFHYLAIPHEMTPDAAWFTTVPGWARRKPQTVFLRAAGYAATDEYSEASGCDPSPDPDVWAGYERYLPESLLGLNLFSGSRTNEGLRSFAEANTAATLVDRTIDKPRSTSEQYLERWANLIETRLAREPRLTPRLKLAVAGYQSVMNGRKPNVVDTDFQERQALFQSFIAKLSAQNNTAALISGTRADLENLINEKPATGPDDTASNDSAEKREGERLWKQTVRPAWKAAMEANQAAGIPAAVAGFERYLLDQEDHGVDYVFGDGDDISDDVFWQAGYDNPQTMNPVRAEAIALWAQERTDKILAWAKTGGNARVREAAERLEQIVPPPDTDNATPDEEDKSQMMGTAAERTLFYRRVLAAWEFLTAVDDRPALARLKELTELERTPLPRTK